jgi:hypothetical protein
MSPYTGGTIPFRIVRDLNDKDLSVKSSMSISTIAMTGL